MTPLPIIACCKSFDEALPFQRVWNRGKPPMGPNAGGATTFARFSSFRGNDPASLPAPLQQAVAWIREHYDMKDHTRANVAHTRGIGDDFVDWFGIVGPATTVRHRFRALADLGLDFVHVVPGSTDADRAVISASLAALSKEVLPAFH